MIDRAYSLLEIKRVTDQTRTITGIATTPTPDRLGDIVEPLGVKFKNPLPLLWQHKADNPVGTVTFDKPTKNGISFTARFPRIEEPGPLRDRVETAYGEVKAGLVKGVSIGFKSLEHSRLDGGGIRFVETEVLELSLVTVPANADATIEMVKSLDRGTLVTSGHKGVKVEITPAGDTAAQAITVVRSKAMPKTIVERIADFEATRASKAALIDGIQNKVADENRTKDAAEREEFDTLTQEIESIDQEIVDLRKQEKLNLIKATAVSSTITTIDQAAETRSGIQRVVMVQKKVPPGTTFTRFLLALARTRGDLMMAERHVQQNEQWLNETPELVPIMKAAVNAGTTTDSVWAGPLVVYQNMQNEFIEYLRPLTIIGRIPNLRRVPFKIKIPRQTTGATVNWVGEAGVKPLTSLAFDTITLEFAKIAGIIPLTEELVRFSSPSAEAIVRDDLAKAIVQFMDIKFIDPASAATAVSPASITYGVAGNTATGTTAAAARLDFKTLLAGMYSNNMASNLVFIMTQQQALSLSLMMNSLGTMQFPGITPEGGTLLGYPVVTSENIPAVAGGSPAGGYPIIVLRAPDILLADDGQVTIDASREASLQMSTTPDSPATASTVSVSLWQQNMVAIKAERFINWGKARSTAVDYIVDARYAE